MLGEVVLGGGICGGASHNVPPDRMPAGGLVYYQPCIVNSVRHTQSLGMQYGLGCTKPRVLSIGAV